MDLEEVPLRAEMVLLAFLMGMERGTPLIRLIWKWFPAFPPLQSYSELDAIITVWMSEKPSFTMNLLGWCVVGTLLI